MRALVKAGGLLMAVTSFGWTQDDVTAGRESAIENAYAIDGVASPDRVSFRIGKETRGTSYPIAERYLLKYCADVDGCKVRLGMFNWDGSARVASRETLLFYNRVNRAWRASLGDTSGTDFDGVMTHVLQTYACYLTDGAHKDFAIDGDDELGFGLVSWNEFEAGCFLTLID